MQNVLPLLLLSVYIYTFRSTLFKPGIKRLLNEGDRVGIDTAWDSTKNVVLCAPILLQNFCLGNYADTQRSQPQVYIVCMNTVALSRTHRVTGRDKYHFNYTRTTGLLFCLCVCGARYTIRGCWHSRGCWTTEELRNVRSLQLTLNVFYKQRTRL